MEFNLIQFCAKESFPCRLFFTYSSEQTLNRIIEPVYRKTHLGLPATWTVIVAWLTASPPKEISPPPPPPTLFKKCPEIPVLPSYSIPPLPLFGPCFPVQQYHSSCLRRLMYFAFKIFIINCVQLGLYINKQLAIQPCSLYYKEHYQIFNSISPPSQSRTHPQLYVTANG